MVRVGRVLAALGLLASLLVTASPSWGAPVPCGAAATRTLKSGLGQQRHALETVTLRTFHIEAKSKKKVYRVGEVAKFPVTVTRPAEEDPLRLGLPWERPMVEPAADINVGVGLLIGEVFLPGFGVTNEQGKVVIKIKMENYVRPATADAAFYAWNVVQETPCLTIQEDGFRVYPGFFTVVK